MSTELAAPTTAAIDEALASLQQFSDPGTNTMVNGPEVEAQLILMSKNTSAAIAALGAMVHTLRPPSNQSPKLAGSLPHDILAEIFKAWFKLPKSYGCSYRRRSMSQGYVAACVNRRWRAVALATPLLWTRTVLDFEATQGINLHLDTILERSKSLPLDVLCRRSPWRPPPDKKLHSSLFDHLAELFSRCAHLSISWRSSDLSDSLCFEDSLLPLLQVPMPHLESLTLSGLFYTAFHRVADNMVNTRLLTLCPKLRTLDLDALPLHFIDARSMDLRSFHCRTTLSGEEFSRLLSAWPTLTALDMHHVKNGSPVVLPELRTLMCANAGIFRCLPAPAHAPCLQHLSISASRPTLEKLAAFLAEVPCTSLRILELRTTLSVYELTRLPPLLPALPELRELRLVELPAGATKGLFKAWTETPQQPPVLEAISLRQCSLDGAATRTLVNFLALRTETSGRAFTSLSIVQRGLLPFNYIVLAAWMRPRLEQLVADLHLDIDSAVQRVTVADT